MKYDLNQENVYGHRVFPDGRALFDAECEKCEAPKMSDCYEEFLGILPEYKRITLNVERLRYVIETIKRENSPN